MNPQELKVLLIEDNAGDARLIQEELADVPGTNVHFDWVERLSAGLERLSEEHFDVVLLDLSLPDSRGLESLERFHAEAPGAPVVVLTGLEDRATAIEAVRAGAQDYLVKGRIEGPDLDRALRYAIERGQAARELDGMRRELAETEKLAALGALVSGVAQDIRAATVDVSNTIFEMRRMVEQAAEGDSDVNTVAESTRDLSVQALEGVAQIDRLVRRLRRFAHAGAGDREQMGLNELAEHAVSLFQATRGGQIVLEAELENTPLVDADAGQVQQLMLILLANAAEASEKRGSVWVRTRTTPEGAELTVRDEGCGMDAETLENAFGPFQSTKADHAGLGLWLAKRIADAHDASIGIESEPGKGTTVTVRFPASALARTAELPGNGQVQAPRSEAPSN